MTTTYKSIFEPTVTRSQGSSLPVFLHNLVRNQISLPTWLAIGAAFQAALLLLPIRRYMALAPAFIWLAWQITSELLIVLHLSTDTYANRMLKTKYTAVFPAAEAQDPNPTDARKFPGGESLCLFILGFECSHALGPLAPGYKDIVALNQEMMADLVREAGSDANESGFLGNTSFFNAANHTTSAGITSILYFRSMADVRRFATGAAHTKGLQWWAKNHKMYPWLGIMHELYEVPKGNWENIYVNHEPTMFAATKHAVKNAEGKKLWASPVVDATRGRMSSTQGRLGEKVY